MLISFRKITVTGFLAWFLAFFVLAFPATELHSAVQFLWRCPFIFLPDVFAYSRLVDRTTLLGLMVGFIFCGSLCDRIGRYNTMLVGLTCAPLSATICGYFADAWLFVILHFGVGVFVAGVLVSSTVLIFETVPPTQRWRMFNIMVVGGALGAIVSFLLEPIGWRFLYQIQLVPIFFVPLLWHWSDETLLWKFAIRDKQVDQNNNTNTTQKETPIATNPNPILSKTPNNNNKIFHWFCTKIINKLANTYFASLSNVLLNRRHLLFPALLLTTFGVCGLAISFMSFGEGVRQRVYQSHDLETRVVSRLQNDEVSENDIDALLVAYLIDKPLLIGLINLDECRIDLLPQVLRSYGYSRDDVSGCVADGLWEFVKRMRGERITKDSVAERAVLRWNSRHGNGHAEIDIPEDDRNRIKLKASGFLEVGERTLHEIQEKNQQADKKNKIRNLNEYRKTNVDKWQIWCDEFLSLWDKLLFVTEIRYSEGEWCVGRLKLFFLVGNLVCGLLCGYGFLFNVFGRGWTQRRIFCVMFAVGALLSMMAVMLQQVNVSFIMSSIYVLICGFLFVPFVTCYLTTIPAMFSVTQRGAAVGFCFGLPLLVVFLLICVIPVPYIYYLIPIYFVAGVFAIGIPARKKQ
jgi:MFS family permease